MNNDQPVTVTPYQASELMSLYGKMPFGASLPQPWAVVDAVGVRTLDPVRLIAWLEALRERLEEHGVEHQRMVTELTELRNQRAAIRGFLGI